MNDPSFFGYGSLVNLRTHNYTNPRPALITGWRRVWRSLGGHDHAVLSVTPDDQTTLAGIIADVPQGDWGALDAREGFYDRQTLPSGTAIYEIKDNIVHPAAPAPILRSYLDVVVQGYLDHFDENGVAAFFSTTDNWGSVLDDRPAPFYPRHQNVDVKVTTLVDHHLAKVLPAPQVL